MYKNKLLVLTWLLKDWIIENNISPLLAISHCATFQNLASNPLEVIIRQSMLLESMTRQLKHRRCKFLSRDTLSKARPSYSRAPDSPENGSRARDQAGTRYSSFNLAAVLLGKLQYAGLYFALVVVSVNHE